MNMQNEIVKKTFSEPECEVIRFTVEDILTTSGDDWGLGEVGAPAAVE